MAQRLVGGWAAVAAALLSALFSISFFVFTHGARSQDRHDTVLGVEGMVVCRASVLLGVALVLACWGLGAETGPRPIRRLASGVTIACLGAVGHLVGRILQCWVADPDRDFNTAPVVIGFQLDALGRAVLATALIWIGTSFARRGRPRVLWLGALLAGAGTWLAGLGPLLLIPEHSAPSLGWDVVAASFGLPSWVGFAMLGVALLKRSSSAATEHATRS